MATFTCANPQCEKSFVSHRSDARFCSRRCANKVNYARVEHKPPPRKYSDEQLIDWLQQIATRLGRTPSETESAAQLGISKHAFRRRFGSYTRATTMAGLVPNVAYAPATQAGERQYISLSLRFRVLQRDEFRCQYCGGTPDKGYELHVDHILPRSKGGKTELENLITACRECNIGKSDTIYPPIAQ